MNPSSSPLRSEKVMAWKYSPSRRLETTMICLAVSSMAAIEPPTRHSAFFFQNGFGSGTTIAARLSQYRHSNTFPQWGHVRSIHISCPALSSFHSTSDGNGLAVFYHQLYFSSINKAAVRTVILSRLFMLILSAGSRPSGRHLRP